jgi:hypothetical protein
MNIAQVCDLLNRSHSTIFVGMPGHDAVNGVHQAANQLRGSSLSFSADRINEALPIARAMVAQRQAQSSAPVVVVFDDMGKCAPSSQAELAKFLDEIRQAPNPVKVVMVWTVDDRLHEQAVKGDFTGFAASTLFDRSYVATVNPGWFERLAGRALARQNAEAAAQQVQPRRPASP